MKRKLSIAFTLIALSLIGIVVFQGYWTVNAYRVNKRQFDANIDSAMLRAMNDCKKDYFDSIRVVMIKKLSSPGFVIRIDTFTAIDPTNTSYEIRMADTSQRESMMLNTPFTTTKPYLDYYKTKINFKGKESIPALLTEMSFYVPNLLYRITWEFEIGRMSSAFKQNRSAAGFNSINNRTKQQAATVLQQLNPNPLALSMRQPTVQRKLQALFRERSIHPLPAGDTTFRHGVKQLLAEQKVRLAANKKAGPIKPVTQTPKPKVADTVIKHNISAIIKEQHMHDMPPNYHMVDSIKIYRYFKSELEKVSITAPFSLVFNHRDTVAKTFKASYSETFTFPYQYHGFAFLTPSRTDRIITYTKAVFKSPQYAVMKTMIINLTLSFLLILLTGSCFIYVMRTIVEQKKLSELKDDFINNMTHELKTPIATITVAIEALQNFNALSDADKTKRYLETSREQLDRLNQLVTKVLNVAAFESKDIDLNIQEVDIDEMVNNIISSEKLKTAKTVNFSYTNTNNIKKVNADKLHLNNVILNLVDNAIKYAGDPVDILISVYTVGSNVCFLIKDNGIGIPAEHIANIFDKFYRVPTGNVHNVKGTGLGLSYVKYIIEAHGGLIVVKSDGRTGTEFIVNLPLSNG